MDIDLTQLAADAAKFLIPFLPYLLKGGKIAAQEAGKKFGEGAWKQAQELWGKLKNPKMEETAQEVVKRAEQKPDNARVRVPLELQLEDTFTVNQTLAEYTQKIIAGDQGIVIGRDMHESVAMTGNENLIANLGGQITQTTNIYNAPTSSPEKDKGQKAFRSYLEKLRRHCNALPLAALGGEESSEEDITLDKIYIDLDTTQSREMSEEESKTQAKSGGRQLPGEKEKAPISVMEAAAKTHRLVLLGEAGAGKSTFAKKLLALQAAVLLGEIQAPLAGFEPDLIPVLIILRDLGSKFAALQLGHLSAENQRQVLADTILEKIREDLSNYKTADFMHALQEAIENGKILLVLDGLDEVPQDLRGRVRQAVGALIQTHQIERIIITSRIRSYTGPAVLQNFQAFTIAPFDAEKISKFARAWYNEQHRLGRVHADQAEKRASDLASAANTPDLTEMSSNPMMLTSIAIIHQKDIGLPRERVRLYHLIVDVLVSRWQKYKTGEEGLAPSPALAAFLKDDNRLRATLEILAYEAHRTGNKEADLTRSNALTLLEKTEYLGGPALASEFLDYVDQRSGLLVGKGGELERPTSYSFPHRTIQEYLAGCYLIGKRERGREFYKHAAEGDFWSLAALMGAEELFYNRRATDALLDIAYCLCPETPLQNEQDQRSLLWSGQIACIVGSEIIQRDTGNPSGGPAYLKRLVPRTVDLLESHLAPRERAEAADTLARLGDPRPGVLPSPMLVGRGAGGEGLDLLFCEIPAGPFLMGSKEDEKGADNDEHPQFEYKKLTHNYFMSRYPVTNAQFETFVLDPEGYRSNQWWSEAGKKWRGERTALNKQGGAFDLPNHPVVNVSWYEAHAFTRWLNERLKVEGSTLQVWRKDQIESLTVESGKWEVRLPSEAEWEKAARGGKQTPYPWGDAITPEHANYSDTNLGTTSAVGVFPAGMNAYGLLDMSGNVLEWCATKWVSNYENYSETEDYDPEGDSARVVRGGAFSDGGWGVRCACRFRYYPDGWVVSLGFRVVVVSPFF